MHQSRQRSSLFQRRRLRDPTRGGVPAVVESCGVEEPLAESALHKSSAPADSCELLPSLAIRVGTHQQSGLRVLAVEDSFHGQIRNLISSTTRVSPKTSICCRAWTSCSRG